jgi:hypothetical protein
VIKAAFAIYGHSLRKNFISAYHMGIYVDKNCSNGLPESIPGSAKQIPYKLIGELASKITPSNRSLCMRENLKKDTNSFL